MSTIRAVIFDLDGTLIDSEPIYQASDQAFFIDKGILVGETDWSDVVGMGAGALVDKLKRDYGLTGDRSELLVEKESFYLRHAQGRVRAFPRTLELVRYLWANGYKLAIATGSGRRVLDEMLAQTHLAGYFEYSVSANEVRRGKPDPESFLAAADRLEVSPSQCLVVEDSQYGVLAAQRAGMPCLAVPARGSEGKPAFDGVALLVAGGPDRIIINEIVEAFNLTGSFVSGSERVTRLRSVVYEHYQAEHRSMPWRETEDPFYILSSEFMLQQTQVSRVIPKYEEFVQRYPTAKALAEVPLSEFLAFWQGLGYNRRAKHLKETAQIIAVNYGGRVPESLELLQSLPGVGPYTASAVAAFAFHQPVCVVETNIRRLFLHFFFAGKPSVSEREVSAAVERAVDRDDPRKWYYALMDYGAYLGRLFPNANRRSARYKRQSRFEGSVRQVRGQVVRALTEIGPMSKHDLESAIGPIDPRFERAFEGLLRDGIISFRDGVVTLD